MSKSYSQLLRDIESGEIISIILIPNRREVIVEFINGDNKIIPQGIDQSKLVPLLTAALKEAITEIESPTFFLKDFVQ